MENTPKRIVYLLTMWQERTDAADSPAGWRFSVEDPRTGERRGFASLEALVAFLRTQMGTEERGRGGDKETR